MVKILFSLFVFLSGISLGQDANPLKVTTRLQKGIEIVQKDSLFSLRFQFRMQNRLGYMSMSDTDFTPESFEFRVRRLRLVMRGFVYNANWTYYIQLSFSRGDMDWDGPAGSVNNTSPNIVRDAMIFYSPIKNLRFGFGQTKLAGNRQRVTSSGNQQFVERSIVNATFTLDRDFGLFATWDKKHYRLKGSVTSGEGRNSTRSDKGLNYTGRLELLPFGKFTGDNEDWEGDLAHEQKIKMVAAISYNYNASALRQGGTIGGDLFSAVNMQNLHADLLIKYKGFAFQQEYTNRLVDNPITISAVLPTSYRTVYNGFGSNTQLSYCFKNKFEVAFRYAMVNPNRNIYDNEVYTTVNVKRQEHIHVGVSKYLYGHRLKAQLNGLYQISKDLKNASNTKQFGVVFQIEFGI